METPASKLRRTGRPQPFKALPIGATFELNGNVWTKRSTRTAVGVWPAVLPPWSYVGAAEVVHA